MTQPQDPKNSVETSSGAQVEGNVNTDTFVGRDQHIHLVPLTIPKYLLWIIIPAILFIVMIAGIATFLLGDIRGVAVATPTVTSTETSTATHTLTPTHTPLPTSTPLPVQPAIDDETLILITNFYLAEGIEDSESHRQIAQAIDEQIQANNLKNVRVGIDSNIRLREEEQESARLDFG